MEVNNFEEVLEEVGSFGRYQYLIIVLTGLADLVMGSHTVGAVFTAGVPDFSCVNDDVTTASAVYWNGTSNVTTRTLVVDASDQCEYVYKNRTFACTQWNYSTKTFESSIVTKVCFFRCLMVYNTYYYVFFQF